MGRQQLLCQLVQSVWKREHQRVHPAMQARLDEELSKLRKRGLWPSRSSLTGTTTYALAVREGETVLDNALAEVLRELKDQGLTSQEISSGLRPAFEECIEQWTARTLAEFYLRARLAGNQGNTVASLSHRLRGRLHAALAPEILKLDLKGDGLSGPAEVAQLEPELLTKLRGLAPELGDSYSQIVSDLNDADRTDTRGTANAIRELLREVVQRLCPHEAKQGKRRERMKAILGAKSVGSNALKVTQQAADLLEAQADLYVRWYECANRASHSSVHPRELQQLWRLAVYVLHEVLPQ